MRELGLTAAIVLLLVASPACANWQFTKWGMSPAQVITASKGMAVRTTSDVAAQHSAEDHTQTAALSTPYTTGSQQFVAYFLFDRANKLVRVSLEPINGDPDDLIGQLTTKYGKPDDVWEIPGVLYSKTWYSGGDMVSVTKIGSTATINYQARVTDENKGL